MARYSVSRGNKLKPQKNDDIYEVNMLATKDGEFVSLNNPLPVTIDTRNAYRLRGRAMTTDGFGNGLPLDGFGNG